MGRLLERLACVIADIERTLSQEQNPYAARCIQANLEGMERTYALYLKLARTHYA